MAVALRRAGRRALAGLILAAAAFVVFKLVMGLVSAVVWGLVIAVLAVAVLWALRAVL